MRHVVETLRAWGPFGVLVLAALDSAGVPLVGGVDALLIWVSVTMPATASASAGMRVVRSLVGSMILFLIARKGGAAYLETYTRSGQGARLKRWFLEYGLLTIFIPAAMPIIPVPLKIFVLSAGALGVSPVVFASVIVIARLLHYYAVAWLALHLGYHTLPYLKAHFWQLLAVAVSLFVLLYLLIKIADRNRKLRRLVIDSE